MQFVVNECRRRYGPPRGFRIPAKMMRMVKWTTILLFISCLHVSASSYSQQVTLQFKNAPLTDVLKAIQKQTGNSYFIKAADVSKAKPVSVHIINEPVKTALEKCFEAQPLTYSIVDKAIIVKVKDLEPTKPAPTFASALPLPPIRGWVLDTAGSPIAGATVMVKNGKQGTITTKDGSFVLNTDEVTATLIVSCVGYITREVDVRQGEELRIPLQPASSELDDVHIIGYGTTTRRLSTGNVNKVSNEAISQQPVTNVLQALQGQVAGLQIIQSTGLPGSPYTVQIRGRNSITASNDPLYIIDGVPFSSAPVERIGGQQGRSNPLNLISPENIESVEVLKDADATAIYGSRAANGVVLITTKKGKEGKTVVDLNLRTGIASVTRMASTLTTSQYLQMRRDALANSGLQPTNSNAPDLTVYDPNAYFNWQDWYMGGTANNTSATVTLSGGDQQTKFLMSGTYHNETTIRSFDKGYRRGSVNMNLQHTSLNNRFNIQTSLFYTADKNHTQYDPQAFVVDIVRSVPNYPLYDSSGKLNWVNSRRNFLATLTGYYKGTSHNLNANTNLSFSLTRNLQLKSSLGYNRVETDQLTATPSSAIDPNTSTLASTIFGRQSLGTFIVEPQLQYNALVGGGKVQLLTGFSLQKSKTIANYTTVTDYQNDLLIENPGYGTPTIFETATLYNYTSVFSRLTYNWQNKYLFNGSFRRDGSSRFGPGKQFGNFYSIGGAWVVSEEPFLKDWKEWLSYAKIRSSYGSTGSDGIGDYGYLSFYAATGSYGAYNALSPTQLANDNFQWEVNKKLEIGFDLGFLKNRILLYAAWYRNRSGNQLVQYALPSTTGFSGYTANLPATVQNKGWEFELNITNISTNGIDWSTSLNLTIPQNKLLRFPNLQTSSYANTYIVGQPLNIKLGYEFLGLDPENGLSMIRDQNSDKLFTPRSMYNGQNGDYIILGTTDPKWYGGIGNTVSFRRFRLDFLFYYTRQKGYNLFSQAASSTFGRANNVWTAYLDYWKAPGDNTAVPKPFATSNESLTQFRNSSAGFNDASFLRLKNINISYSFPSRITKKVGIDQLQCYVQGQNIWTLTNYNGYDPETAANTTLMVPLLKTFVIGINCTL